MQKERLFEIDVLRFMAALFVVLFHYTVSVKHAYNYNLFDSSGINTCLGYGNLGVELFFLISGFVILLSAQNSLPLGFLKSRAIRLYPAFLPICILTWVIGTWLVSGYDISFKKLILNLSLIGTLFTDKYVSGVYWTLRVEIQFYMFILLILLLGKINRIRVFLNTWLILSIITHFGLIYTPFHQLFAIGRYLFITDYAYYFIAGCYFFLVRFKEKKTDTLLIVTCWLCSIFLSPFPNQNGVWAGMVVSVFYLVFYMIALRKISLPNHPAIKSLGGITYPLYLSHELIGLLLIGFLLKYLPRQAVFFITIAIMIVFSYLVFKYEELTMKHLKRISKKNQANHEQTATAK